jgi:hypothetical protein
MEETMELLKRWVSARMPADAHAYISWFAEFQQDDKIVPPVASVPQGEGKAKAKKSKKKGKKGKK